MKARKTHNLKQTRKQVRSKWVRKRERKSEDGSPNTTRGVRRQITAKKLASKDFLEVENKFYPFVSGKAKALFTDHISKKPIIEKRTLTWDEDTGKKEIVRIIYNLSRMNFFTNSGEGLQSRGEQG